MTGSGGVCEKTEQVWCDLPPESEGSEYVNGDPTSEVLG